MSSPAAVTDAPSRAAAVDTVADHLLLRASLVTRLLLRQGTSGLSRAEAGLLGGLLDEGPQRVTALAAAQALAQPTVTQLVALLEQRGLVVRERDPGDRRAVVVAITAAGRTALEDLRAGYRSLLREQLIGRPDEDLFALAAATEVLLDVIDALKAGPDA
jgi:DNA-binding MarR family transcriptional regulator